MPTSQTKGITVKIDAALHAEIKAYLEQNEMTMSEFIALAVQDELHPKIQETEVHSMENMRTLAFQVPESLFQRIKDYLKRNGMTQKAFVLGLIEEELDRDEELQPFHGNGRKAHSALRSCSSLNANSFWYWWLCDAYASNSYDVRYVNSSGAMDWNYACNGNRGVRPLCNLLSSILVSDSPDSDGAYTIIWNRAPSTPPSLTVPTTVRGGQTLTVTWGTSTDADGNLSGYILERQNNGGAWKQLYKGINKSRENLLNFFVIYS